jgi:hypothetical protein
MKIIRDIHVIVKALFIVSIIVLILYIIKPLPNIFNLSEERLDEVNLIILNVNLAFLTGIILYFFTAVLPTSKKIKSNRKSIDYYKEEIKKICNEILIVFDINYIYENNIEAINSTINKKDIFNDKMPLLNGGEIIIYKHISKLINEILIAFNLLLEFNEYLSNNERDRILMIKKNDGFKILIQLHELTYIHNINQYRFYNNVEEDITDNNLLYFILSNTSGTTKEINISHELSKIISEANNIIE